MEIEADLAIHVEIEADLAIHVETEADAVVQNNSDEYIDQYMTPRIFYPDSLPGTGLGKREND